MELHDYWAKTSPFQSVLTHGIVSGRVAQVLAERYLCAGTKALLEKELCLDPSGLKAFLGYLVSLHDIGKIEYSFQAKDPSMRAKLALDPENARSLIDERVRHEKTGCRILFRIWESLGEDEESIYLFSAVIGAHHPGRSGPEGRRAKPSWIAAQQAFAERMKQVFLSDAQSLLPVVDEDLPGAVGAAALSLLILSDWISSGPAFADAEEWIESEDADKRIEAIAESFLSRSELAPVYHSWPESFCATWHAIPPDGLRPLQRETEHLFEDQAEKISLLLLEAPMGEGKTEAGVYAALRMAKQWGKDGFYLALPTAATANQMVGRMRALLLEHGLEERVRLLHGMAWLEKTDVAPAGPAEEADGIANWLAPVRRGLLGQYAVGTIDQAMLAATIVKYGALRLLGLANKVLVIDEIHSYDAYMSEIISRLLEWCKALEIPVVMLSATLPPTKKQELFAAYTSESLSQTYPLITAITANGTVIERVVPETTHRMAADISFLPYLNDEKRIAEAAAGAVQGGGCLCVLMNTVRQAQEVYTALKQIYSGDLMLFHAQFPAQRRAELEEACIRRYGKDKSVRPKQSILVATQVVEQSLDVDFDAMITAVAPIDLLVQRLGRVHRHDAAERPEAFLTPSLQVLIPEEGHGFGSNMYVYPVCLLESSIRVLRGTPELRIPEDVARVVREGYSPELAPPDQMQEFMKHLTEDQVKAGAAQEYVINPPEKQYNALIYSMLFEDDDSNLSAATRLGEPTVRLALIDDELYERLAPYLKTTSDGAVFAEVWDKTIAERVMLQSVSVRASRFKDGMSRFLYIQGDKLLSGTRILRTVNGSCQVGDHTILRNDPELGIRIEEGVI